MAPVAHSLAALIELRKVIESWARQRLKADNPDYVAAFTAELVGGDVEGAIAKAKPLLGHKPDWYAAVTAVVDVELGLDQVSRALSFLKASPAADGSELANPGAWVVYHVDHWTLFMDALFERVENLIKITVQSAVKYKMSGWAEFQGGLLGKVKSMKDEVGKVRHPLAHGGGGGVTGLENDRLWEPYLAAEFDDLTDFVQEYYQSVSRGNYQENWYQRLDAVTQIIRDRLNDIFEELAQQKFPP